MGKGGLVLFSFVFCAVFIANFIFFIDGGNEGYSNITGKYLEGVHLPFGMDLSIFLFALQWVVLSFIIVLIYSKILMNRRQLMVNNNLKLMINKRLENETNIDVFYNLLKEKKKLNLNSIAEIFKVKENIVEEWAKILENHEIAEISYPAFGDPEVKFLEKEKPKEKEPENCKVDNIIKKVEETPLEETKEEIIKEIENEGKVPQKIALKEEKLAERFVKKIDYKNSNEKKLKRLEHLHKMKNKR